MPEQIHDHLVKFLFTNPDDAASALAPLLPKAISARVDWATLRKPDLKLIGPRLDELYTDLLFEAWFLDGQPLFIYLLFEHQSAPHRLMPFRFLHYMVNIWQTFLREHPKASKLPPVMPILLHHGPSGWTAPRRMIDVIDAPEDFLPLIEGFTPKFEFILDDLKHVSDADLRSRSLTALMAAGFVLLKKAPTSEDLAADLFGWLDVFVKVAQAPNGLDALRLLMEYTARAAKANEQQVLQFARQIGHHAEQFYMGAAQQIEERGLARGRAEGKAELLELLLARRFGSLPGQVTDRLRQASDEELELFADRVLTAVTLDEVLAPA